MVANLGVNESLCCALGGESGRVLRALIESEPLTLRAVDAGTPNGVYVHDRRSGERVEVVSVESRPLERHAVDALYGLALSAGVDADVTLITGCQPDNVIDPEVYRRLCADLRANGKSAIADLTGAPLRAVLKGGVELLRPSAEELVSEDFAVSTDPADLVMAARQLQSAGANHVLISRGATPALLIDDGGSSVQIELVPPVFETMDRRGTGDSMFAATGVGLARGMSMIDALRLGMAAGALNATRRGLGTGTREEIERLATHVTMRQKTAELDCVAEPGSRG